MVSNTGSFTLSLDCEGLWGMADLDKVVHAGAINQVSLDEAYHFVDATLDRSGLQCTAAFVSCFAAGQEAVREQLALIDTMAELMPQWFRHISHALHHRQYNGWEGRRYFEQMKRAGHEMGWHGTTHLSWANSTPEAAINLELQLLDRLCPALGQRPTSIVFPRNVIGHLPQLQQAGFDTYRDASGASTLDRVLSLAREWHVADAGSPALPRTQDGWHVVPAGFFLNWPSGVRRFVPPTVTVMRWKCMIDRAVREGRAVHMWLHPHNFITAPAMKWAFTEIIAHVGALVRLGDLHNATMGGGASTDRLEQLAPCR